MARMLCWFTATLLLLWTTAIGTVRGGNVTYDGRSLIIDGQHKILFSGSIHYPRSTPDMWSSLISKAKAGGIDVIQTYVFWNLHEPQQGQFYFSGRADLVRFVKEIQAQGLYACLRIGPFIESEWTYGGLPFWLHDIPGIVFRSDNEPFKYHMERFVSRIVNMMKSEKLYASQGGPIILSQVENEYKMVEAAFHEKGPSYVQGGSDGRKSSNWSALGDVSIHAMECDVEKHSQDQTHRISHQYGLRTGQVYLLTSSPTRLQYHGGTNFGRTASAFTITSYYDQAPLDEYGLIRQPKWGHLKELHAAIKSCSKLLLDGAYKTFSLGPLQQDNDAAFLVNNDGKQDVGVLFQSNSYKLPQKSISILPDCKTVTFNTAIVNAQYTTRSMTPNQKFNSVGKWEEYKEPIPEFDKTSLRSNRLLEHMSTTKDSSDYLWYTFRFQQNLPNAESVLNAQSRDTLLHAYVNGVHAGSGHGSHQNTGFSLQTAVRLKNGTNNVALLSATVGLPDSGAYLERKVAGLRRLRIQNKDFTTYKWGYQVGLLGERLQIYMKNRSNIVKWNMLREPINHSCGTSATVYYRLLSHLLFAETLFDAPAGNDPVALNLGSMGKGEAWVNGPKHWPILGIVPYFPKDALHKHEEESGNPLGITVDTVSSYKKYVAMHLNHTCLQFSLVVLQTETFLRSFLQALEPSGNCEGYATGNCHSSSSKVNVEKACKGKGSCSIPQSNQFFGGDPCPGIPKVLLVDAQCT
ncbi:hypothetical protein OIU76_001859 [Salix suchowensis]|nr:hypothetical protein OIU76_001859 [Salix suchowensis]